jgi:hypothetical protein
MSFRSPEPPSRGVGLRRAVVAGGLFVWMIGALSCSERITEIDPSLQPPGFPEGQPDVSQLMIWPDTPNRVFRYKDAPPRGPNNQATNPDPFAPPDTLVGFREVYDIGAGVVRGLIFDDSPAERYQMFRREGAAGFRPLKDFLLRRVHPVLDSAVSRVDLLEFTDRAPFPAGLRAYIGRGVIGDVVTADAPLTNLARTSRDTVTRHVRFLGFTLGRLNADTTATEGISITWQTVPGAIGYWVQIFQLGTQTGEDIIRAGAPTPLFSGNSRDFTVAWVPDSAGAAVQRFDIQNPAPGVRVLMAKRLIFGLEYIVRISAINSEGDLIACSGFSERPFDWRVFQIENEFEIFTLGGTLIQLTRPEPPPARPRF